MVLSHSIPKQVRIDVYRVLKRKQSDWLGVFDSSIGTGLLGRINTQHWLPPTQKLLFDNLGFSEESEFYLLQY
jgi:hypothetical protein